MKQRRRLALTLIFSPRSPKALWCLGGRTQRNARCNCLITSQLYSTSTSDIGLFYFTQRREDAKLYDALTVGHREMPVVIVWLLYSYTRPQPRTLVFSYFTQRREDAKLYDGLTVGPREMPVLIVWLLYSYTRPQPRTMDFHISRKGPKTQSFMMPWR